jgi:hypothetical protein
MTKYNTEKEILDFLTDRKNIENCGHCPYDMGCTGCNQLPCGQYHCWVYLHCKAVEDYEAAEE